MKRMIMLLCACLLLAGACYAETTANLDIGGSLAVYSISKETYVREAPGDLTNLGADEFISFRIYITNTAAQTRSFRNVYFRVDDGEKLVWVGLKLKAGETTDCHIYNVNMKKLSYGQHKFTFYVEDTLVYTGYFNIGREWKYYMTLPSDSSVSAADKTSKARSPYVVYYPQFNGVTGVTEYSIDFCIDDLPRGTYFSTLDADMDISSLTKKYKSVTNDYCSAGGFYCGFQRLENGHTAVIMSVWDLFCTDKNGNKTVICATQLYPEYKVGVSKTSGEGSFQQFITDYLWSAGHCYRMLMQTNKSESTGNTVLTMWVCDLETMAWTELVSWDLGYYSGYIKTASLAGFLEDYLWSYSADVRNVSFSNIRGCNSSTGKWVTADKVKFTVNNSIGSLDYSGSYNFGADQRAYYIITSGISGLCTSPANGTYVWTQASESGRPY